MKLLRPLALAFGAGVGLTIAEAVLSAARGGPDGSPPAIHSSVSIDAPREAVWATLADIEAQPRWMRDAKSIRVLSPGPVGPGTHAEANVRIFGISTRDLVEISDWEPLRRYGIRHLGRVTGHGDIRLADGGRPGSTAVVWDELLVFPVLPHVTAAVMGPILDRIFQADLERLRDVVEADSAPERG